MTLAFCDATIYNYSILKLGQCLFSMPKNKKYPLGYLYNEDKL